MVVLQDRSKRKHSGGRNTSTRPRRLHQAGRRSILTKIDEQKRKQDRCRSANVKTRLISANKVNLFDPKTKKCSISDIKNVLENPANRHYVRRNILTKGTVIETAKGKARITNRPGQEGQVTAVLI